MRGVNCAPTHFGQFARTGREKPSQFLGRVQSQGKLKAPNLTQMSVKYVVRALAGLALVVLQYLDQFELYGENYK